jgi:hypothetical protein
MMSMLMTILIDEDDVLDDTDIRYRVQTPFIFNCLSSNYAERRQQ